MTCPEAI